MEEYLYFTRDTRVLTNTNRVILINRNNGRKLKITKECYDILSNISKEKISLQQILDDFQEEEDKDYFNKLIKILKDYDILSDKFLNKESRKIEKVMFKITNKCNLKCYHCSVDAKVDSNIKEIDFEDIKRIIDILVQENPKLLVFTGGEPLVRKDIFDILDYCKSVYRGSIQLMTNGTLINEENVKKIVSCVDDIDISIDGIDEKSCSLIRGKGVFEKVISSVRLLKKFDFNRISLSMVQVKSTEALVEKFYELNRELGTRPMIRAFADIGRGKKNKDLFRSDDEDVQALNSFENNNFEKVRLNKFFYKLKTCTCGAGKREIMINEFGDVYPCVLLNLDKYKICNILDLKNMSELNEKLNHNCTSLNNIQPDNYKRCKDCNVNLFCWGCIEELDRLSRETKRFERRCKVNKGKLQEAVWNI